MTTLANSRFAALLLLTTVLTGCATTNAFQLGKNAEPRSGLRPGGHRIHPRPSTGSGQPGARFGPRTSEASRGTGTLHAGAPRNAARLDEALVELQLAAELNPTDPNIAQLLSSVENQIRTKVAVARDGKTELEMLIERSRSMQPPGLELPADVRLPTSSPSAMRVPGTSTRRSPGSRI